MIQDLLNTNEKIEKEYQLPSENATLFKTTRRIFIARNNTSETEFLKDKISGFSYLFDKTWTNGITFLSIAVVLFIAFILTLNLQFFNSFRVFLPVVPIIFIAIGLSFLYSKEILTIHIDGFSKPIVFSYKIWLFKKDRNKKLYPLIKELRD